MSSPPAFNPLDKRNLGESVGLALSRCPAVPLSAVPSFKGAGVYALYYSGAFTPYAALASLNRASASVAIYVGKAVPEGARKGLAAKPSAESRKLRTRLSEHARSIKETQTLDVADFTCRYLVVEETWIGLCESLLIQASMPLWNTVLEGFGRHVQGINRKDGVSAWHAFHAGRDTKVAAVVSEHYAAKLSADVAAFMAAVQAKSAPT